MYSRGSVCVIRKIHPMEQAWFSRAFGAGPASVRAVNFPQTGFVVLY